MPTTQSNLAKKYDSAASNWQNRIEPLGYPVAYSMVLEAALCDTDITDWRVLDAGTGSGEFSNALLRSIGQPKRLDLIDISEKMLRNAEISLSNNCLTLNISVGRIEDIPGQQAYDLIICAHVIEHCDQPIAALNALNLALKPGGILVLVASKPHWCTVLIQAIWRSKSYSVAKMRAMLNQAEFTGITPYLFQKGPPKRTSAGYIARRKE